MRERVPGLMAQLARAPEGGEARLPTMTLSWSLSWIRCAWGEAQSFSLTSQNLAPVSVSRWRWEGPRGLLARLLRRDTVRHWLCVMLRSSDGFEVSMRARVPDPEMLEGLPFHCLDGELVEEATLLGVLSAALGGLEGTLARWDDAQLEPPAQRAAEAPHRHVFEGEQLLVQMFADRLEMEEGIRAICHFKSETRGRDGGLPAEIWVPARDEIRAIERLQAWLKDEP